ncbi:MAG: ATP-dependent helicase [Candidatus Altiarchaeales archaeon HGW-Altiarchaeales-2]|nr:MAG: ATP-dependent helicase [Candidatus Altiarchaeales archaeon HGW-Altiarchaeales-2]
MLFKLRGMDENEIMEELRKIRGTEEKTQEKEKTKQKIAESNEEILSKSNIAQFWIKDNEFEKISISVNLPVVSMPLLKRLGNPQFLACDNFFEEMEKIYKFISENAIKQSYEKEQKEGKSENNNEYDVQHGNIILHGVWQTENKKFFIWGETFKPVEKSKIKNQKIHPFASGTNEILNFLMSFFNFKKVCSERSLLLYLPTSKNLPLLSTSLSSPSDEIHLAQWNVPGIEISAGDALFLLSQISTNEKCMGNDISFWSTSAKFCLELIARQRFIPFVARNKTAKWRMIFNYTDDAKRYKILINSIPYACFSYGNKISPDKILEDFLNTCADESIRAWFRDKIKSETWKAKIGENLIGMLLSSLLSDNNKIKGTTYQQNTLTDGFEKWTAIFEETKSDSTAHSPFRTCFRLEEPLDNEWKISFHLQNTEDPSLLLSARDIMMHNIKSISKIIHKKFNAEEYLLRDLAAASRHFSPVNRGLRERSPSECSLNLPEAYKFLKEDAWLLEECGYGILVPSWWKRDKAAAQLGVNITASPKSDSKTVKFFGLDDILDFKWEIAIGDMSLSKTELEGLAKLKIPLINVRGKWVEFKKEDVEKALKFLSGVENDGMDLSLAMRLNAGIEDIGIPVLKFDAKKWVKNFISTEPYSEIKTPESFNGVLRNYQIKGFSWLNFLKNFGFGACLADDMGLGKTIEVIAFLLHEKKNNNAEKNTPVLLVAPMSVVGNWKHEFEKFSPDLRIMVHHGSGRLETRKFLKESKGYDVVVTTYSLAVRDGEIFDKIKWNGIILDEAQNIKNPETKQARAIKGLKSNYKIALTGTPIENRLTELWSIMDFLNPSYLSELSKFKENFSIPIERYRNEDASEKLRKLVSPFIMRRLKTDKSIISDLPEKMEMKMYCTLTKEQVTLYKAVVEDMMQVIEESEGIKRRGMILSALTKLKQICNHPALFLHDNSRTDDRSGKLSRLKEMAEEVIESKEKALIFTQYSEMGEILKNYFESLYGREIFFLHGGVSRNKRDMMVDKFQNCSDSPLFILSIKAGGFGLNLTKANHVFHFDRWWNPAVETQATDRAFRIGQSKNVFVHKFIAKGTLEEKIDEMIESKKELSEKILSAGESAITDFSNEKLREIFKLRD